jgi:hypothetical protein
MVMAAVMFAQLVNLGVAVVASGDAVSRARGLDLLVLESSVFQALVLVTGLEKAAAPAAAVVVGAVGDMSMKFSSPTTDLTTKRRSSAMGSP